MARVVRLLGGVLAIGLAIAPSALAGWSPPVSLGAAAGTPVIGFDPSGNAALVFSGNDGAIYLVRHPQGGAFSGAERVAGFSQAPDQVVLTGDGATVVRAGSTMFVEPSGSTAFGPPQELGGPQQFDLPPADAVIAPTSKDEVIASISDNDLQEETSVLRPGAAAFGPASGYRRFYPIGGPAAIATDAAGGAFITDLSTERCRKSRESSIVVAYRPAHRRFDVTTPLRCRPMVVPNSPPSVLAASGRGRAVLATVDGTLNHYQVLVQVRAGARFGRPRLLASVHPHNPNVIGPPIIGPGGAVTLAWDSCAGDVAHCVSGAAHGSADGRVWRTRTFSAPSNRFGIGVPQVGDGYVILSRCSGSSCALSASYADASGRFGNPQQITAAGQPVYPDQLAAASGGQRRLGLFMWTSPAGGILAATINSRTHRFGAPSRVAPGGAGTLGVDYELGPNGQAIVAWRNRDGTASAATYSP